MKLPTSVLDPFEESVLSFEAFEIPSCFKMVIYLFLSSAAENSETCRFKI